MCPATYKVKTKRKLSNRIKEHKNNNKEIVVFTHKTSFSPNHDLTGQILQYWAKHHWKERLISEMLHINSSNNSIKKNEIFIIDVIFINR